MKRHFVLGFLTVLLFACGGSEQESSSCVQLMEQRNLVNKATELNG